MRWRWRRTRLAAARPAAVHGGHPHPGAIRAGPDVGGPAPHHAQTGRRPHVPPSDAAGVHADADRDDLTDPPARLL
ncbi:hypothetical protein GA0070618_6494 [Micromonospora echinospora]|uniref:Uncharacterized protein n=1 Tax=Micromonospora echinospora TaxID=1877 RepID=A0A1C5A7Y4_MICEC|nr:hypothetical protein GA0070618_6494 [Micromonospora echinospora]